MFDKKERKMIESIGLNCILIDDNNKNRKYIELDYLDKEKFSFNKNLSNTILWDKKLFQDLNICFCGLPVLIVNPIYWSDIYIETLNKYHVESLIFSKYLTTFLKKQTAKATPLQNIEFLKETPHLKHFYLERLNDGIFFQNWEVKDFSILESMQQLECLGIPNDETFVDIDFSKLQQLKNVNLQYPIENKTIYQCHNIEKIDTRYYEEDLEIMKNWKKLKYFSAYCDNLESFEGVNFFARLETLKVEVTSKFNTFDRLKSKSIKTFFLYTEAKKTPKTLDGISGLSKVEDIALNGLNRLESVQDLSKCITLKELTLENCKIPSDIYALKSLKNLEKLTLDNCRDIETLEFIKELQNLRYLSFTGNTKVLDANLKFLKNMSNAGVEVYFANRKHYNVKSSDLIT